LETVVRSTTRSQRASDWNTVAADFERICADAGALEMTPRSGHQIA
jgi:hypothetical protein